MQGTTYLRDKCSGTSPNLNEQVLGLDGCLVNITFWVLQRSGCQDGIIADLLGDIPWRKGEEGWRRQGGPWGHEKGLPFIKEPRKEGGRKTRWEAFQFTMGFQENFSQCWQQRTCINTLSPAQRWAGSTMGRRMSGDRGCMSGGAAAGTASLLCPPQQGPGVFSRLL